MTAAVPAPGVVAFEIGNHPSCVCSHSMSGSSGGVVDERGDGTAAAAAPVVGA